MYAVDVVVEPDPNFPLWTKVLQLLIRLVRNTSGGSTYRKLGLVDFVSSNVMPAVMYDSGEKGGVIKLENDWCFRVK